MAPSFPDTRMQLVSLAALLLQQGGSVPRFPSSVRRGSVETFPSVAALAVTSHSLQTERR